MLQAEQVRKRFGTNDVLKGVDLSVDQHEVVCLIGASGSGKSTLLRCLNVLETIDDGVIIFDGREISDPRVDVNEVRRDIGMVDPRPSRRAQQSEDETAEHDDRGHCRNESAAQAAPAPEPAAF